LLLLTELGVGDALLRTVGDTTCPGNLALHLLVVLLNLSQRSVKLVQLLLGLVHLPGLVFDIGLLLLIVLVELFILLLGLLPVPFNDVVVVLRLLILNLHLRQALLDAVQLHTDVFLLLTLLL
jgi:hypothetical protein